MAFTQINGILNIAITGGTVAGRIEYESFSWKAGSTRIQFYEIVINGNGVWLKNAGAAGNAQVIQLCPDLTTSNSYRAKTNTQQIAQVTSAIQSYYNNKIGLANGTIQPVLT